MNFEINMINVEDGDSIILQLEKLDKKALIVIDGGYKKHYLKLKKRVEQLLPKYDNKIDLIICSHYDNDHLEGISLLLDDCHAKGVEIGEIWLHKIEYTLEDLISHINEKLQVESEHLANKLRNIKLAGIVSESIEYDISILPEDKLVIENYKYLMGLLQKMIDYGLESKIKEVVQGCFLDGFEEFKVISPTSDYYNDFLPQLKQEIFINDVKNSAKSLLSESASEKSYEELILDTEKPCERLQISSLRNRVTPTNMVSIVTLLNTGAKRFLFTADSGIESFEVQQLLNLELKDLDWLQLPHHGSKNNSSKTMLDHFNPKRVFVSGKGIENRPDSCIIKCLQTKNRFENYEVTNSNSETWYLKINQNMEFERILQS